MTTANSHSLAWLPAALALLLLGSSPARAADTWHFGVVEAKSDAGFFFMPQAFGPKYGVDIQMVAFASSNTPVKGLLSGDLEVFATSPAIALVAISHGAALKFVGCDWPGTDYVLYGAHDIKSIADLKGKSIAVSGPGSMPDLFAREVLSQNHIAPSDVVFANAGGGAERFRALVAGVVQATATTSEFEPRAVTEGYTILASAHDTMPDFIRDCIVTSDETIAHRRDGLIRFLAANMEGLAYTLGHRNETIALSHKVAHLPDSDTSAAFIYDQAISQHAIDPTLAIPRDKLQWIEDLLLRQHKIARSDDVAAFIDDGPRQKALERQVH